MSRLRPEWLDGKDRSHTWEDWTKDWTRPIAGIYWPFLLSGTLVSEVLSPLFTAGTLGYA